MSKENMYGEKNLKKKIATFVKKKESNKYVAIINFKKIQRINIGRFKTSPNKALQVSIES